MRIIYDQDEITETARGWLAGGSVGMVIVTGNVHAGYLASLRSSLQECEISVVCMLDNGMQLESPKTLTQVPSHHIANLQLLDHEHIDIVFIPRTQDFFSPGFSTYVVPTGSIAERLGGFLSSKDIRTFATSIVKLFQLVRPDKVYFSQKNAYEVALIRKLVSDLNIDLDLRVLPIERENDGVAVDNQIDLLSQAERQAVVLIYQALLAGKSMIEKGEHNTSIIKKEIAGLIATEPLLKLDYVAICNPNTLEELGEKFGASLPDFLLAISVSVGVAKLVDNILWNSNGFWLT